MKLYVYAYSRNVFLNLEKAQKLGLNVIKKSFQKFLKENKRNHFIKSNTHIFILVPEEKLEEFSIEFLNKFNSIEIMHFSREIDWNNIVSKLDNKNSNKIINGIVYNLYAEETKLHFDDIEESKEKKVNNDDNIDTEDAEFNSSDDNIYYEDDEDADKIFSLRKIKELDAKNLRKETFDFITKKVKGQNEAVNIISLCFTKFIKSIQSNKEFCDHVILIGNSGSGKTEIARNLFDFIKMKKLHIKTETINASYISATGYKGINMLEKIETDKYKIFFIDEFDKMFIRTGSEKDNYNEAILANFLTVLEDKKSFFIFAGVFKDIDKMIEKNIEAKKAGFNLYEVKNEVKNVKTIDPLNQAMTAYALDSQEFIGRISHIVKLNKINSETVNSVLDDRINTFASNLESYGVSIDEKFKEDILEIYHNDELSKNYGVRYIDKILAKIEEAVAISENPQSELYKTVNRLKSKLDIKKMEMVHC